MSWLASLLDEWIMEVYGTGRAPLNFVTYFVARIPAYRRRVVMIWLTLQEPDLTIPSIPAPDLSFLNDAPED